MAHKTPLLVADLGPDVEPFLLQLCAALAENSDRGGGPGACFGDNLRGDKLVEQGPHRGRQHAVILMLGEKIPERMAERFDLRHRLCGVSLSRTAWQSARCA